MHKELTAERLKELYSYDPATGDFTQLRNTRTCQAGEVRTRINSWGYKYLSIDGRPYLCHRLAVLYVTGKHPEHLVDHRDQDKLNNIYTNLRQATRSQNNMNKNPITTNKSGVTGVHQRANGRWKAEASRKGKVVCIGTYATLEEAAEARAAYVKEHYGDFAVTQTGEDQGKL